MRARPGERLWWWCRRRGGAVARCGGCRRTSHPHSSVAQYRSLHHAAGHVEESAQPAEASAAAVQAAELPSTSATITGSSGRRRMQSSGGTGGRGADTPREETSGRRASSVRGQLAWASMRAKGRERILPRPRTLAHLDLGCVFSFFLSLHLD